MLNIVLFLLKWICENHAEINNIRFCNQLKYAFFFFLNENMRENIMRGLFDSQTKVCIGTFELIFDRLFILINK